VAVDTQDYYLSSTKLKVFSFKIENIEYSDKFTKAKVDALVKKTYPGAIPVEITVTQSDTWKIVNGKWMWYTTPPGNVLVELTGQVIPKDAKPATVASAASSIKPTTSVDKRSLTFTLGSAGTEQVVFHNGNRGPVKLVADVIGNWTEIKVDPITGVVGTSEDSTVKIIYAPEKNLTMPTQIRLSVEPFGQKILIPVTFASQPSPAK